MQDNRTCRQSTLVLGAGELGMSVLRSLAVVAEPGMVAVLLRPYRGKSSDSSKQKNIDELLSLGVSLVEGDLAELSASSMAGILRRYDTVVSCTGFVGGSGTQRKIANAALLAGVKRFVPWQFGVDYDVIGRGSAQDLFDEQLDVRDLLRSQTQVQWLIVSTGMFTSFLFEPAFGVFDLEQGTVHGLGSWENAVTLTTAEDIGRLTVEVLTVEPPMINQVVFVAGDTVTYGEAANLVEQVSGKHLKREIWTVPQLQAQLAKEPQNAMAKYHVIFAEGRGVSWPVDRTFNQEHRLPVTDLRRWLTDQHVSSAVGAKHP